MKPVGANTTTRIASESDLAQIHRIYFEASQETDFNYETRVKSLPEMRAWFSSLREKDYPIVVAEIETVVGYGFLSPFHPNTGYRFTATGSLYVDSRYHGQGVGKAIAAKLYKAARERAIHTVIAGVNAKNLISQRLLQSFGFEKVGYFREIANKNGVWQDDVCLQLMISEPTENRNSLPKSSLKDER